MSKVKIKKWSEHSNQECIIGQEAWHIPRLIYLSKDLPVVEVPLEYIGLTNRYYGDMSLRDFVMHMEAVLEADLTCPIILGEDGEILDGRHRITKALHERRETILAVKFDVNPKPCRVEE